MKPLKIWLNKKALALWHWPKRYWRRSWFTKLISVVVILVVLVVIAMYSIAQWYINSQANQPLTLGATFVPDYATSLGVDPESTMKALISIGVKNFRLVSYWNDIEPQPNQYDFSQLDWQFKLAEQAHAKIILTVGLRQPRWPECHPPAWVNFNQPESTWQPQLESFMNKVIERYKNSPSLTSYQLENEYFLHGGGLSVGNGACNNYDRQRLISEYNLLKRLDPNHPVIIPRSNNAIGFPTGQPQPDEYGISVYKRVWDAGITHRYLEYPIPAWYYAFLAGYQKLFLHKNMIIDELQAEAWPPNGKNIPQISLAEQNKSLDSKLLKDRFDYGKATGMKTIYLWGAEYWYYRLIVLHDPSLWQVAKDQFTHQ